MIRSKKLRDSARGETCTLQIAGVCNHDPETTTLAHVPVFGEHGMALKADDLVAAYGCSACHDRFDRRTMPHLTIEETYFYAGRGMARTLRRMVERGLLKVEGSK